MVKTARAVLYLSKDIPKKIFLDKEGYVFVKRTKYIDGKEYIYYTFPGGHVEEGESFEEAAKRELLEELNISVDIIKEELHFINEALNREEIFYTVKFKDGIFKEGNGEEFADCNVQKYGKFEIEVVDKDELEKINILPIEMKKILIKKAKND